MFSKRLAASRSPGGSPRWPRQSPDYAFGHCEAPDRVDPGSRTLAAMRDALLPKLISGEIRIKDAEQITARLV